MWRFAGNWPYCEFEIEAPACLIHFSRKLSCSIGIGAL
jgi:hypothetical protein